MSDIPNELDDEFEELLEMAYEKGKKYHIVILKEHHKQNRESVAETKNFMLEKREG